MPKKYITMKFFVSCTAHAANLSGSDIYEDSNDLTWGTYAQVHTYYTCIGYILKLMIDE